jgi:hypothetical protein
MTKTAARAQARRESSMYRQGAGWIVSTWDGGYKANRLTGEMSYWSARTFLREWREERAADLLPYVARGPKVNHD